MGAESLIKNILQHWYNGYGTPQAILSDQGRNYISRIYINFQREHQVESKYATAFNPTGNSISERINQTINDLMKIYKGESLKKTIQMINTRLNFTHHRIIGCSPIEIYQGFHPLDLIQRSRNLLAQAVKNSAFANQERMEKINQSRQQNFVYKPGDLIVLRQLNPLKTDPYYLGPYEVIEVATNTLKIKEENRISTVNLKRVKPFLKGQNVVTSVPTI